MLVHISYTKIKFTFFSKSVDEYCHVDDTKRKIPIDNAILNEDWNHHVANLRAIKTLFQADLVKDDIHDHNISSMIQNSSKNHF